MNDIVTEKNKEIDSLLSNGWKRIGSYKNAKSKIEFVCGNGHTVFLRLDHYIRGIRCSLCSGFRQLTNLDIDNRLETGWKRNSDYINNSTPIELVCPKGHIVKIAWSNYQQGKRCAVCFRDNNNGSNHHSWKSWLTDAIRERRARKNKEYKQWRLDVYKKDNYTCQICKNKSKDLHAHHLESFCSNVNLRYEKSNGVTLCKKCHIDFHREYGISNNTKLQFEEYKNGKRIHCR